MDQKWHRRNRAGQQVQRSTLKMFFINTDLHYPEGCVAYGVTKTYLKPLQITSKTLVLVSDILWHYVQEGKPSLSYSQPASAPQKRINQAKKENPYGSFSLCLPWQERMRLLHPQNKWYWDEMVPHSFLIGSSFHLCKQNILVSSNRG